MSAEPPTGSQRLAGARLPAPTPRAGNGSGLMTPGDIAAALDELTCWGERTPPPRLDPAHRDLDVARRLGLPDELPPVRLPRRSELVQMAADGLLLIRARDLALWLGAGGRGYTATEELGPDDAEQAARTLGVPVRARASAPLAVDLQRLWYVAVTSGFVDFDEERVTASAKAAAWPALDAENVLFTWRMALNDMLDSAVLAELGDGGLTFPAIGGTLTILLFLARRDGVPGTQLSALIKESALRDLPAGAGGKKWRAWIERHGDPLHLLLGPLVELGALEIVDKPEPDLGTPITQFGPFGVPVPGAPAADGAEEQGGERVRLTPLGLWALWDKLTSGGVQIPLLPPVEDMTVPDLVRFSQVARPVELAVERAAWLAHHDPVRAARELLAFAPGADPVERVHAVVISSGILKDHADAGTAETVWREALERWETRPFAKVELAGLRRRALADPGPDTAPPDPEFALAAEERSWMLVDLVMAHTARVPDKYIPYRLRGLLDGGSEQVIHLIESLQRQRHPAVTQALDLLGHHFPDKKVAKAARKTLYKIASRNN